jgi:hypothetical protein
MEAPHPTQPVVLNAGGAVLASPKVVPVFFACEDGAAKTEIESFLAALAPSSCWTAITQEYGVGALTIAPSVVTSETLPATITDSKR